MFAQNPCSTAKITAVEPHPTVLPYLYENARTFDFEVLPKAVAPMTGFLQLDVKGDSVTASVCNATLNNQVASCARVEGIEWGDLLESWPGPIDLLKCDCEGGEKWLLDQPKLLNKVRLIAMEYHHEHVSKPEVYSALSLAGFRVLSHSTGPVSGHVVAFRELRGH